MEQLKQQILQEFEEKTTNVNISDDIFDSVKSLQEKRKWLEDNSSRHLFIDDTYPESELELDEEKIKEFLSYAITTAYEKGREELANDIVDTINKKIQIHTFLGNQWTGISLPKVEVNPHMEKIMELDNLKTKYLDLINKTK